MRSAKRIGLGIACITIAVGIILVIIGLAAGGGQYRRTSFYQFEDRITEKIDSIELDVAYGTVNLVTGDDFQISVYNMEEDEIENYVEAGTWYIREKEDNKDYAIDLFGVNLPIFHLELNRDITVNNAPRIVITIPEDFEAEDIEIKLAAGTLTAEKLNTSKLALKVSAGSMEVENLIVSGSGTLECGAGELIVHEIDGKDLEVNCGLGSIKLGGVLIGETTVECGVGSVILDLNGEEEDYNYSVDCGIGNVIINNSSYGGTTHKTVRNDGAGSSFDLECDIGEIQLYIR